MKQLKMVVLCSLLILNYSCTKEEEIEPIGEIEQSNGISADDLDAYQGDLGILINTRDLVKKGYTASSVKITTTAKEGNYDQTLSLDSFTGMARLSLPIDSLTEAAATELRNGIGLTIDVIDATGNTIVTKAYSVVSFEENGNQLDIDASGLSFVSQPLQFKKGTRYYLQAVDANGNYDNTVVWKPTGAGTKNVILRTRASTFNADTHSEQFFLYKLPNRAQTYVIYSASTGRYLATDSNDKTFRQSGAVSYPTGIADNSLHPVYWFIIKREKNGLITINDRTGKPMRRYLNNFNISWRTNTGGAIQYFRIITLDIDWEVQELDTKHLPPIFPAVETSFGFNSTLRNCGSGTLEQQVGIEREVETTYRSSVSESIGLSGRVTSSVEASVSTTAEASFFGNGGSVTGEVSTSLEVSVEASKTTTVASEQSVSETHKFFSTRTVTVPPGSASLVYDAYQTYSNVRIPYVKRLRLKGQDSNTLAALSGAEIATQLLITSFSGTITNIGTDYVEITISGNMYLDNIVDTQTEVRDVPANCN